MERPQLHQHPDLPAYLRAMARFRRELDPSFSVAAASRHEHRCSPALVSLVLSGKRQLTLDRLTSFCHIFGLNPKERLQVKMLLEGDSPSAKVEVEPEPRQTGRRRRVSSSLLKDWLNPYVKDAIRLESVRRGGLRGLFIELASIASERRIERAIKFLRHHGYIKVNAHGQLVEAEPLAVVPDAQADVYIKRFHHQALSIAQHGLATFDVNERLAQAMILPLDANSYMEMVGMIGEFAERIQKFAEDHAQVDRRLYQLIVHLTPTGGTKIDLPKKTS